MTINGYHQNLCLCPKSNSHIDTNIKLIGFSFIIHFIHKMFCMSQVVFCQSLQLFTLLLYDYRIFPRIRWSASKSTAWLWGWKMSKILDLRISRSPTLSREWHAINVPSAVQQYWHDAKLTARDDLHSSLGQIERQCRMLLAQEKMMSLTSDR